MMCNNEIIYKGWVKNGISRRAYYLDYYPETTTNEWDYSISIDRDVIKLWAGFTGESKVTLL